MILNGNHNDTRFLCFNFAISVDGYDGRIAAVIDQHTTIVLKISGEGRIQLVGLTYFQYNFKSIQYDTCIGIGNGRFLCDGDGKNCFIFAVNVCYCDNNAARFQCGDLSVCIYTDNAAVRGLIVQGGIIGIVFGNERSDDISGAFFFQGDFIFLQCNARINIDTLGDSDCTGCHILSIDISNGYNRSSHFLGKDFTGTVYGDGTAGGREDQHTVIGFELGDKGGYQLERVACLQFQGGLVQSDTCIGVGQYYFIANCNRAGGGVFTVAVFYCDGNDTLFQCYNKSTLIHRCN